MMALDLGVREAFAWPLCIQWSCQGGASRLQVFSTVALMHSPPWDNVIPCFLFPGRSLHLPLDSLIHCLVGFFLLGDFEQCLFYVPFMMVVHVSPNCLCIDLMT